MNRSLLLGLLLLMALGTACGTGAPATANVTPTAIMPAPTATTMAATSPAATAPERISGKVQSSTAEKVTLEDGKSFALMPTTRIIRTVPATPADLKQGQYVAVTAKPQPDHTLLASVVNVFPPAMGQVAPGQRPMDGGNLMTNATIERVEGQTLTVKFPGGEANVQVAPDGKVNTMLLGSPADVTAGMTVSALVVNGTAQSLSILSAQP